MQRSRFLSPRVVATVDEQAAAVPTARLEVLDALHAGPTEVDVFLSGLLADGA